MTQEPTLVNDPEVYGNELRIKTELKQTVTTADGSSVVKYKTFIKRNDDGSSEVKIWPVNDDGLIIAGSKPIFENGAWNENQITLPKTHSNRTSTNQLNTTLDGIDVISTTKEGYTRTTKDLELTGGGFADAAYIEANTDENGKFTGNPVMPPYILNGEEITYERFMEIKQEQLDGVNILDKYGIEETTVVPPVTTTVVEGPLFKEIQEATVNHARITNDPAPEWAKNEELSRVDEIKNELKKLREEGYEKTGNTKTDMRRSMQWTQQIRDLEKELAIEEAKVEFNQTEGGTDSDIQNGVSKSTGLIKYAFDRDDEVTFRTPVKYPRDLSMQQDHMIIQCYTYQPPYNREVTKTDKNTNGGGGAAFGAQRGTPFRRKIGAPIILPMPNQINDSNQRMWEESNMNNQALDAVRKSASKTGIKAFLSNLNLGGAFATADNIGAFFQQTSQQAGRADFAANQMSQIVADAGFDVSADQILARTGGVIANSNTELLFSGVSLRSFEFSWLLSARDDREAHNIRMILRAFKQWSSPRKISKLVSGDQNAGNTGLAGGPSYFLGTPNVFKLRYETAGNKPILGLNKFKACALTDISINYTPEGQWMAYDHGQPTSYSMTLKFNELEPIYNTDYNENIGDKDRVEGPVADLEGVLNVNQDDPSTSMIGY